MRAESVLVLFVCKEETHNEIHSWRSVGLLHARQKALADNYAYGVYRLYHHVLCGSSRNRSFRAWAFCDARTSFTTSANIGSRGRRRELRNSGDQIARRESQDPCSCQAA